MVRARLSLELPEVCVLGVAAALVVLAEHGAAVKSALEPAEDRPPA